jgi:hypothetical protein
MPYELTVRRERVQPRRSQASARRVTVDGTESSDGLLVQKPATETVLKNRRAYTNPSASDRSSRQLTAVASVGPLATGVLGHTDVESDMGNSSWVCWHLHCRADP